MRNSRGVRRQMPAYNDRVGLSAPLNFREASYFEACCSG